MQGNSSKRVLPDVREGIRVNDFIKFWGRSTNLLKNKKWKAIWTVRPEEEIRVHPLFYESPCTNSPNKKST